MLAQLRCHLCSAPAAAVGTAVAAANAATSSSSGDDAATGAVCVGMTEATREATLQFMCRCNGVPTNPAGSPHSGGYARFTQYLDGDPDRVNSDTRLVVLQDGSIASQLRVWRRSLRVGSTAVPMAGIGGVMTDSTYQGNGFASMMMRDANEYMARSGFEVAVLFSEIPSRFYRTVGYESFPMTGFTIQLPHGSSSSFDRASSSSSKSSKSKLPAGKQNGAATVVNSNLWRVRPFHEERDLLACIALHRNANHNLSGTLVRPDRYWYAAPARLRQVLPTHVVVRAAAGEVAGQQETQEQERIGGYLNVMSAPLLDTPPTACAADGSGPRQALTLLEVATAVNTSDEAAVLQTMVRWLMQSEGAGASGGAAPIATVSGDFSPEHPLPQLLLGMSGGDLQMTGNSSMMLCCLRLYDLLCRLLPELQQRLDRSALTLPHEAVLPVRINGQCCLLHINLGNDGKTGILSVQELSVEEDDPDKWPCPLPPQLFWAALFGVYSASILERLIVVHSAEAAAVNPGTMDMVRALFSERRPCIYWPNDHF